MTFLKKVLFDCFINFGATLISAYLLYDDLLLFISKPTHSSKFNEKLQPKHLPDFFVCPIPAFDLDILKKHGYSGGYMYMKGIFTSNVANMRGWNGNSSDTNQTFIDEISVIKVVNDCPRFSAMFQHNIEADKSIIGSFTLTNPIFPYGRCCKVFLNENETISHIMRVTVKVNHKKRIKLFDGFRLFMISKENSHFLKLGNSYKNGIDLKAMVHERGHKYYSVKLTEEFDLQEDPKVTCKNYAKPNSYSKVSILKEDKVMGFFLFSVS